MKSVQQPLSALNFVASSRFGLTASLVVSVVLATLCITPSSVGQAPSSVVPTLVNFSGILTDASNKPLTGTVGVTFLLYKDEQGGSPLWMETQNVQSDKSGRYTVTLGSTTNQGLPTSLFASGEARWLGVQAQGQTERPRVLLLSVPYALKAGDAQTVGGLSPSAFVLAAPAGSSASANSANTGGSDNAPPAGAVTGSGTLDFLPIWTGKSTIGNSVLFQTGSGKTAKLGINSTTPASTLDVNGGATIRGLFSLPATGTATSSKGFNSQPEDLVTSAFNSGTKTAVPQTFQWQAEPVGNNTSNANGSLNLLFGQGTGKPAETGLNIASNGQITFAKGQTFPGTGNGTITGVTAGTDLTGGGNSGNVTLNVDTTKVPQLKTANTFTGNQTINGNLTDSGNISASGSITGKTGVFSGNNTTQILNVTQAGTGFGIQGQAAGTQAIGIAGIATNTSSGAGSVGVEGYSVSPAGAGVFGFSQDTTNAGSGVVAYSASPFGSGLYGYTTGANGNGVYGRFQNASNTGVGIGQVGVWGDSASGFGVIGTSDHFTGVVGESDFGVGVFGNGLDDGAAGVIAEVHGQNSSALYAANYYGTGNNSTAITAITDQSSSIAIDGVSYAYSGSGSGFSNMGVWGDSGASGNFGVVGTTDDGNSLFGVNNTVKHETLYAENNSGFNGGTPIVARFAGPGSSTYCYVPRDSNDNGTGDIVCTGSKSAAVPVQGNRMVRMYAVEAADNWFEDAGSGQLNNGSASVALDQMFAQTVNGDLDYHVFITPNGDCEGLYVSNKTARGFEVHELHKGTSNIAFDYRIMVRRKGFENVRLQDVTADFAQMKHESELLQARLDANKAQHPTRPKLQMPELPKRVPASARPASLPVAGFNLGRTVKK